MPYHSPAVENQLSERANWTWLAATLLAQTAWGAYPVLARYLQTISNLPSLSLIALGNLLALFVVGIIFLPRIQWRDMWSRRLVVFSMIVIGRGVTNFLAARYTLAIYVQLIMLMTPFIVAILSTVIWHEQLPRYTGRAILLGSAGVIMIIGVDLLGSSAAIAPGDSNWLGIGLTILSSFLLAFYMLAVRRSAVHDIGGETLLIVQLVALSGAGFVLSFLIGESWQAWTRITAVDWLVFAAMVLGVLVGANLSQIGAIRHLGAALVSSTMPWRLVSVLIVSMLLLNERLTSIWQALGVVLVIGTVSWYLWQQRA